MEEIMRSRLVLLTLSFYLMFAVIGCTSKPPASSGNDMNSQQSTDNGTNSGTSTDSGTSTSPGPAASEPAKARTPAAKSASPASSKAEAVAAPLVVPTGTVLTIRLDQAVGSKISQSGEPFTGTLSSAIDVDGKAAIPAGARASGVVSDAKALGKFKGGAVLQLKLNSIEVEGKARSIETSSVVREEKGKGKRTAVLAGGGAAVGALIGGLAGGGKGAAIGALAGGGAGTAGAAYTGNKDIVLPAEAAVSFKLESPLELRK
jgi:hypothetical protein